MFGGSDQTQRQVVSRYREENDSLQNLRKSTTDQLVAKLRVIADLRKRNDELIQNDSTLKQITALISGQSTDKEKELQSTIAKDRKEINSLKEQLKNSRPIETVDLTNQIEPGTASEEEEDESEPPLKRRRMHSNLAIALEQNQQLVKVKEEANKRAAAAESDMEEVRREKAAIEAALTEVQEESQRMVKVKYEVVTARDEAINRAATAESVIRQVRREKDAVEASLRDVQEQSQQMAKVKEEANERAAAAESGLEDVRREKHAVEASQGMFKKIWKMPMN